MASFTNYATLSYNGGTANSNTVTGEILETLSAVKTAITGDYTSNSEIAYALSLVNSGTAAITGIEITDDLGGYTFGENTVYPLSYKDGSLRLYINGVLQPTPTVTAGPPLAVTGISIPAGGNAMVLYETSVTGFAPLGATDSINNTASVTGTGITSAITAEAQVAPANRAALGINKSICPSTVTENGRLTYTFTIENYGNTQTDNTTNAVLTDTFDPILKSLSVSFNGEVWTEGVNYTYDETTGVFTTIAGQIGVPAAEYTRRADGTWSITPGTSEIVVTGTV